MSILQRVLACRMASPPCKISFDYIGLHRIISDYIRLHQTTSDYIRLHQITSDYIRLHLITSDCIRLLQTTLNYCGIGLTSIEFVRALSCKQRIMCTNSIFTGWLSPFPCSDARLFPKKMRTLTGNSPVNVPVYVITFYL